MSFLARAAFVVCKLFDEFLKVFFEKVDIERKVSRRQQTHEKLPIMQRVNRHKQTGCVAQSVTCLAKDLSLTADPGVASSIPARSHTFVEIDYKIISTVILHPSAESFKKGCCQIQVKVYARSTG